MRKDRWRRTLAVVMAFWLPLTLGEPGAVHICPAHGSAPAAITHADHEHESSHSPASRQGPTAPGHDHVTCTCLGSCGPSGFAAVLPPIGRRLSAPITVADSRIPRDTRQAPRFMPARLLPFANGPPVIVTAA
jgi:hypothetical protein